MTLTIKDTTELDSQGKPGVSSRNSENKVNQSPRSNPVCLEVGVTIRSLPAETGGQIQPIREEGRTVIVFDNGAVLRSSNNMPVGQTVILSDPNGRDVVCRVVGGRNLPNLKGYVEVEFMEPVADFWHIHQNVEPVFVPAPPAPALAPLQPSAEVPPPFVTPRDADPADDFAESAVLSSGSGPTFEDIAGLVSMSPPARTAEKKIGLETPSARMKIAEDSARGIAEIAKPDPQATSRPSASEPRTEKPAILATEEASSASSRIPPSPGDFMSKGLLSSVQTPASSTASSGRMKLVLGGAALVLVGLGAGMFLMHRSAAPVPAAATVVASQPSASEPLAAGSAPAPSQALQGSPAQEVTQAKPANTVAPNPAAPSIAAAVASPSGTELPDAKRQEKNTNNGKQPDLSSSRRPVIPNLKMSSPSAPKQILPNVGEGTAPVTEIVSSEAAGGASPAGLLTSAVRSSNQPAPPPSTLASVIPGKTAREPKLISSTRLIYPAAAKAANIQGSVLVSASVDEHGNVTAVKALSGPMLLRQAAVESVQQWKYSPALIDGKPASSQVSVNLEFRLK